MNTYVIMGTITLNSDLTDEQVASELESLLIETGQVLNVEIEVDKIEEND